MQRLYEWAMTMVSFRSETRELDEEARRLAGGSFLRLADGVTHYELGNPNGRQTVVLVHGFSVPCFIFDPTFLDMKLDRQFQDRYMAQMQYKGFRRAILSTIRNHMLNSFIGIYRKLGSLDKPVLLIWGRHDTTVPLSHSEDLVAAMPKAEFLVIEDSSHIPHYEKPQETNPLLLDFLRKP